MTVMEEKQITEWDAIIEAKVVEWNRLNTLNSTLNDQKTSITDGLDAQISANNVTMETLGHEVVDLLFNYTTITGKDANDNEDWDLIIQAYADAGEKSDIDA